MFFLFSRTEGSTFGHIFTIRLGSLLHSTPQIVRKSFILKINNQMSARRQKSEELRRCVAGKIIYFRKYF